MNAEVANEISEVMLEVTRQLQKSLIDVRERCSDSEFHAYRRAVGVVLSDVLIEVLNPLYKEHPALKPPGMD